MEKWINTFLLKTKYLVGLSDWKILVVKETLPEETFADVSPDLFEKEMTLRLNSIFFTFPKKRQKNILLHELIHCRILVCKLESDEISKIREEYMVNDLARGMEDLI